MDGGGWVCVCTRLWQDGFEHLVWVSELGAGSGRWRLEFAEEEGRPLEILLTRGAIAPSSGWVPLGATGTSVKAQHIPCPSSQWLPYCPHTFMKGLLCVSVDSSVRPWWTGETRARPLGSPLQWKLDKKQRLRSVCDAQKWQQVPWWNRLPGWELLTVSWTDLHSVFLVKTFTPKGVENNFD